MLLTLLLNNFLSTILIEANSSLFREKSDRIDNIEQQLKSLTAMLTQKNQETVREFQGKYKENGYSCKN